jgi:hypothetical protein
MNASNVLRRLQARSAACGLPGDFHRDPGIFELDLKLISYQEWQLAAHTAELLQTASYLTPVSRVVLQPHAGATGR